MVEIGGWDFFLEEGKTPVGVVLVHEIFGLNDYIKSVANEFSRNGYWAAAVDIFRGEKPATLEEGRKIRESLTKEEVVDALGNGLKLLRQRIGENARVGAMGFCMGEDSRCWVRAIWNSIFASTTMASFRILRRSKD